MTEKEDKGRLDIGYRTTAGKHLIIELKRPGVVVDVGDVVVRQLRRYYAEVKKLLERLPDYSRDTVEIILVVKDQPQGWDSSTEREMAVRMLSSCNGRIVSYDDLLDRAQRAYEEYRARARDLDRLEPVLQEIENLGDIQVDVDQ